MTSIGKLLVFVNVFLAVGLLAWAVSLYANRVELIDAKTGDGQTVEGHITKMKKEITELTAAVGTADGRYGVNERELYRAEATRDLRAYVLQSRLRRARGEAGAGAAKFNVQLPDPLNSSWTDVSREGPVVQYQGADLEGVRAVQDKLDAIVKDIALAGAGQADRELTAADAVRITNLAGKPELEAELDGRSLGDLRRILGLVSTQVGYAENATRKQRDIFANLREEQEFIKDNRLNWVVQLQTLERRQRQLDARLKPYAAAQPN